MPADGKKRPAPGARRSCTGDARNTALRPEPPLHYFLLRRWWRVLRSSLRCFFFDMRLRRFLTTEPIHTSLIMVLLCENRDDRIRYEPRKNASGKSSGLAEPSPAPSPAR